jgi:hypothetical protein
LSSPDGPTGLAFVNFRAQAAALDAAERLNLQPAACRFLLATIAGYTNGHPAFPSYERLASRTGLAERSVRLYVKILVDTGYLTLSRRKSQNGGWGQPEWALGPTCQVAAGSHLPKVEVATGSQSSGNPLPHASGNRQPQKRESSTTTVAVGVSNGGGKSGSVVKRAAEEKGPPTPQPAPPAKRVGNARVQALIDALRAQGHPAIAAALTPADFQATARGDFEPAQMARCMIALATGDDEWIKKSFSVAMILRFRYSGWLVKQTTAQARPQPNGTTGAILRWVNNKHAQEEAARANDRRAVRPALPPPGPGL